MKKSPQNILNAQVSVSFFLILLTAYGSLLFHPDLHTACPENDTWNLPIRWSVLTALREGRIPLWNSLSAFGMPWLATWQTEVFYPGTRLFQWIGLSFWNASGILHLFIFGLGIFRFLSLHRVQPLWAFFSASIALLNGCAYNHLGSNSSMDTMAWMPWVFVAVHEILSRPSPGSSLAPGSMLSLFLVLQIFAGYPQVIFYTLLGVLAYALFLKGWRSLLWLAPYCFTALLFSACQWLPSAEYFFLQCVRLPAIHDNPHFYLPLANLKTFFSFTALGSKNTPDYVVSPTYFYFNLYSGLIPPAILAGGVLLFRKLDSGGRFFLLGFFGVLLWALGFFLKGFELAHIPFPDFLEPAKSWVLLVLFELLAAGCILQNLFPRPGKWKWALLAASLLNLLIPIWNHPLERNFLPGDPRLETESKKISDSLKEGSRILILPGPTEHNALYTPLPNPERSPLFKYFIPNSNLFASLPVATFYGSTWPSWGAMDAASYFRGTFPYERHTLIDLLGVDLLFLPAGKMPNRFQRLETIGNWVLWKNPKAIGRTFLFTGRPQVASRKEAFTAFANEDLDPVENLFLGPELVSSPAWRSLDPGDTAGAVSFSAPANSYMVVNQNAMPGWRAWINGDPSPIFLADGIFQCAPVPEGKNQILKLAYEPGSFRVGLFLSFLGFVGIGIAGGLRRQPMI